MSTRPSIRTPKELRFGAFQLIPSERRLLREGKPVVIGARALDVLVALVTCRSRVLTKHELLSAVWSGVIVEENTLQAQISAIRRVIGNQAIATISGRGYRFVMAAEERDAPENSIQVVPGADEADRQVLEAQLPFSVPASVSSFIGRQRELGEIASRIRSGVRLLTVTGPAGSGKTRVAIEAASLLRFDHPDGLFWVELACETETDGVMGKISRAVQAPVKLSEWLQRKDSLLILDNFEQAISAAPAIALLLSDCPRLKCIVTSRELLRVRGEVEYALPPLEAQEAISLFCERAQVVSSEAIGRLCASLDNLPLAIELAAPWMRTASAEQLLRRLPEGLHLWQGGRDAVARHHSLRSAMDWSYESLSAEEACLFARLSIFSGGWTLEAAEEVASASLQSLQSLAEKNLISQRAGRFSMLQLLRQYAAARLTEAQSESDLRDAHASYFASLASGISRGVRKEAGQLDLLRADQDNFVAALDWLSQRGSGDAQFELALSLGSLWYSGGSHGTAKRLLERALNDAGPSCSARKRARALRMLGDLAIDVGAYGESKGYLAEALRLFEESGALKCTPVCLVELGIASTCLGETESAREFLSRGLDVARHHGAGSSIAWALLNYGKLLVETGELVEAESAIEESLSISRIEGDDVGVAGCIFQLGRISLLKGNSARALEQLRASLRTFAEFGIWTAATEPLSKLAEAMTTAGDGSEREAALILGAISGFVNRCGIRVEPSLQASIDSTMSVGASRIGEEFQSQFAYGKSLSLNAAAELALA